MEKIRIGIAGLNFGRAIVEQLKTGSGKKYVEIAAVCDMDREKADDMASQLEVRAYYSLEELLADGEIEAVGLFTGPVGRAALIRKIIRAGKDVMTTKPFELNPVEAQKVLQEAWEAGRVVHLNSPSPLLTAELELAKQWMTDYRLGCPVAARCDVWGNYREKADGKWYDDPELCPVAPIFRLGIYLINDLVRIFGEAEKVQVFHSRLFTGRPTPDNAQLGILFKNGAIANIFASLCINDSQFYKNSMVLNFENGTIYRNIEPMPVKRNNRSKMMLVTGDGRNDILVERKTLGETSGQYQWDAFYRAVKGEGRGGTVSPEEVVQGIRIIHAMARAEKSGCTEKVFAEGEEKEY